MKKILLSADCFYPAQLGGPSNAIYWQARALTQAGYDVTVVATSHHLPPFMPTNQWLTLDCGRVIYTKNPHFYAPLGHIWYGWHSIRKADVVHVNSLFYPASLSWVILSRLCGKPVVWSPHGEVSPSALTIRPRLKRLLLWIMNGFRSSVVFHATSLMEAGHIQLQFGSNVRVVTIHNRMTLPKPVVTTGSITPYLLFIGRLHPIKAIDRLLEALGQSQVFRKSDYKLIIAGPIVDKTYGQTLIELVNRLQLSQKVSWIGQIIGEQKEILYANARLTILPSHTENFGNVVIESLAQGTPVVASTQTPWQLLETERAGSWVNNDPTSLQTVIDAYMTMPMADYQGYRKRAIELARQQFDNQCGALEWKRLYERVLSTTT